ncbi:hypothetical protein RHMOL_Rhmol05G0316700 [Rhododendron molle]|uniref:Uncharacterized protein n=1 Tax=Rhododendron molle TaxID=49168 RepID=A0ACC0NV79_RHOML|nr:hypothetical protein RHMOL_Rhmol05G0316700 [Rhododendron molle]
MPIFEDAIQILVSVIMRKSISIFCEVAYLLLGIVSISNQMIRFSSLFIRRPNVVYSGQYSSMSSMFARRDR